MNFNSGIFQFATIESDIDKMLKKENPSLIEIIGNEEFTTEMKTNDSLINFLLEDEHLSQIIQFATLQFSDEIDVSQRETLHKNSIVVFTEDCFEVKEKIEKTTRFSHQIVSVLSSDVSERIAMACVIIKSLMKIPYAQTFNIFKNTEKIIEMVCNHLHQSEVFDLIYEMMTIQGGNYPKVIEWLCDEGLIKKIISKMIEYENDENHSMIYSNVLEFMKKIIQWNQSSIDSPAIEFITTFNNESTLSELIDKIFENENSRPLNIYIQSTFNLFALLMSCSTSKTYSDLRYLPGSLDIVFNHLDDIEKYLDAYADDQSKSTSQIVTSIMACLSEFCTSGFSTVNESLSERERLFQIICDILFIENNNCSIMKQEIMKCFIGILRMKENDGVKIAFMDNGGTFTYLMDNDKKAVEKKNETNLGPECLTFGSQLMLVIYDEICQVEKCPTLHEKLGDNSDFIEAMKEFINYMRDVVIPRECKKSNYFNEVKDILDIDIEGLLNKEKDI